MPLYWAYRQRMAANSSLVMELSGDVYKRQVKARLNAENDVGAVLFADKGHGELGARHVDALVVRNPASVDHLAHNVGFSDMDRFQFQQAVVDQYTGAGP